MDSDSLQTSFWIMIFVQTIGSVDMPGRGARKMPAPRQYVAILVTWVILGLASRINDGAERAAAVFGWVLVAAGMVIGPFGQRVVGFLKSVATNFQTGTPVGLVTEVNTPPINTSTPPEPATGPGAPKWITLPSPKLP